MACSYFRPHRQDRHIHLCGKESVPVCSFPGCGREGIILCDGPAPVGSKRKTCDRPLCLKHASEVSKNVHVCREHAQGLLMVVPAARVIPDESQITDLTSCRDSECLHRKRCLRWTDCMDVKAIQVFDFGATKAAASFMCKWFDSYSVKK